MKASKYFFLVCLLFFCFILLDSCKKDNNSSPSLTAKINGKSWSALSYFAYKDNSGQINIVAEAADSTVLSVFFTYTGKKTYQQTATLSECYCYYSETTIPQPYESITGTLTVEDMGSGKISCSFNFTLSRLDQTIELSDGHFNDLSISQR